MKKCSRWLVFAVLWVGLCLALEFYARHAQQFHLWGWKLARPDVFPMDMAKVWNHSFYHANFNRLSEQPDVWTFPANNPNPRYLFKPMIRLSFDRGKLRLSNPDETPYWSCNSHGFRGPEIRQEKTKYRIVCIGASTTEGSQSDNETYPFFLQRRLPEAEVINAGHHGQNLVDIEAILRTKVLPLNPDRVIFYEAANTMNVREFASGPDFITAIPDGRWWLHAVNPLYLWFWDHSAAFESGAKRIRNAPQPLWHRFHARERRKPCVVDYSYWLRAIAADCKRAGCELSIVSFVTVAHDGLNVDPKRQPLLWDDLHRKWYPLTPGEIGGIYSQFNDAARQVATSFNAQWIDAASRFPKDPTLFPFDSIHLSPAGNQILAEIIGDEVRKAMNRQCQN